MGRRKAQHLNSTSPTRWSAMIIVAVASFYSAKFSPTNAQQQHAEALAALGSADNMKKLTDLYGLATQIMNLGGSFIGGGNNGGGGGGATAGGAAATSPFSAFGSTNYNNNKGSSNNNMNNLFSGFDGTMSGGLNSVLGEITKPKYDGGYASGYKSSPYKQQQISPAAGFGTAGAEYGGGPLGATGSRPQSRSIIESLMGTFLGSSVDSDGNSQQPAASIYAPTFSEYGGGGNSRSAASTAGGGASNIDAIVRSLVRSGAKRADGAESDGATSFLSQFFGRK